MAHACGASGAPHRDTLVLPPTSQPWPTVRCMTGGYLCQGGRVVCRVTRSIQRIPRVSKTTRIKNGHAVHLEGSLKNKQNMFRLALWYSRQVLKGYKTLHCCPAASRGGSKAPGMLQCMPGGRQAEPWANGIPGRC